MKKLSQIHTRYRSLLRKAGWKPNPTGMFKQPSIAKGSPGRIACEEMASREGDLRPIMDEFLLAPR